MQSTLHTLFTQYGGMGGDVPAILSVPHTSPAGTPYLEYPGVLVLAQPQVSLERLAGFLDGFAPQLRFSRYGEDSDPLQSGAQLCKLAGQLCYMSFGPRRTKNKDATRYFDNIKQSRHGSVLEHATYSFLLYGISRSVTHEIVRHRHFSFSQVSQRYVSGKTLRFVERPEYREDATLHQQFLQRIDYIAQAHRMTVEHLADLQKSGAHLLTAEAKTDLRKKVQQAARSLLPNETEAPLVMTGNARAWRHFLEMRGSNHAEIEIRELAFRIFLCLTQCDTLLFDDYRVEQLEDGTYTIQTDYSHV